jgi:hypothetical protein
MAGKITPDFASSNSRSVKFSLHVGHGISVDADAFAAVFAK